MSRTNAQTPAPASTSTPRPKTGRPSGWALGTCLSWGLAGLIALQAVVSATGRLGAAGWAVGTGCGAALGLLVRLGISRDGRDVLRPGDVVTFVRGLLACLVAALTAESLLGRPSATMALASVAVLALILDAVDGPVARRTGTVTRFGGRFDGEVDAFLIGVLSLAAASSLGWWVLAGGLARYAFGAAGWALPWLRRELEFRYWRKVATATAGVTFTIAATNAVPRALEVMGAAVGLGLLAESFGRDVLWLWRHRSSPATAHRGPARVRVRAARVTAGAALALSWWALLAPARPNQFSALLFLRLPVEAVVLAAVILVVPAPARRLVATLAGALLGAIALSKVLDLGTYVVLDRPFDIVTDLGTLGSGLSFVRDSAGTWAAAGSLLGGVCALGIAVVGIPWAVQRTAAAAATHRNASLRAVAVIAGAWTVVAVLGLHAPRGAPIAAADGGPYAVAKVEAMTAALRDRATFDRALANDPFHRPGSADLSTLRGKDVLVVFVESYGRVALDGPAATPVRDLLEAYTARMAASGVGARSAFLTSSTFGGNSWLAHATLQSGLWVDSQSRYDQLLASERSTLTSVFSRDGWRTVGLLPSIQGGWPDGKAFYHFDEVYGRSALGYAGPTFGFSAMPDQYTLAAFARLELGQPHPRPVMAEIELTSSHAPWAPLPTTVDDASLGDGSVFNRLGAHAQSAADLWRNPAAVPTAYRASIAYSLTSLLSFAERLHDDDLVLVVLGDHQPSTVVSGYGGNHDVPVSVIASDPSVLHAVASWGWGPGLLPGAAAPVWPMDTFRDRFLSDFSTPSTAPTAGRQR